MEEGRDYSNGARQKRQLRRNQNGRFVPNSPFNQRKKKRIHQQHKYKEKKRETQNNIFDGYLSAFVLSGKESDYIQASRSKGLFSLLFEGIVKEDFRLGSNLRYALLKQYYAEGGHLNSASHKALKLPVKPQKYKACRLPQVKYRSEMSAVQKWIEMVANENALLFSTVDLALEFCKEKLRDGATGADIIKPPLHPVTENKGQESTVCSNCRCSVSSARENAISTSEGYGLLETEASVIQTTSTATSIRQGPVPEAPLSDETISWPQLSDLTENVRADLMRSKKLEVCLEVAKHEKSYLLPHLVLDETLESTFGAYSSQYLRELKKRGEKPNALVRQLMTYSHKRRFPSPIRFEFELLEEHIRDTAIITDRVRSILSTKENPLPLYKDMKWENMI